MNQKKSFFKLIGFESLYMLLINVLAGVATFVQSIFKVYIDNYSNVIFSGSKYHYNYFMYFFGAVLYFGGAFFFYKKFEQKFNLVSELSVVLKIFSWIILVIWGIVMFFVELSVLFASVFGLTNNLGPEILVDFTLLGWPVIIVLYLGIEWLRKSRG